MSMNKIQMDIFYGEDFDNESKWIKYEIDELMKPVLEFVIGKCASDYFDKKDEQFGKFEEDKMPDGFTLLTVSFEGRHIEEGVYISELEKKYFEDIFKSFNVKTIKPCSKHGKDGNSDCDECMRNLLEFASENDGIEDNSITSTIIPDESEN